MKNEHQPVLLDEAVSGLITDRQGIYVDCTFGRGGHAARILSALHEEAKLLAFDQDPKAADATHQACFQDPRFRFFSESFTNMEIRLQELGWLGDISGILLDLGVSTPQLDNPERGFSFAKDGPLDMRMDPRQGITAATWINSAKAQEIEFVLREYGEERFAHRITQAIVNTRKQNPINTTKALADLIEQTVPRTEKKHPATRSFQAIRILINQELEQLRQILTQAGRALKVGGRLVVISFHSLEDRLVKNFIHPKKTIDQLSKFVVIQTEVALSFRQLGKPQKPGYAEIKQNPRARSATMRIAEKIA